MAAPIAHIFLAIQMLAGPFNGLYNEKDFIVGTSFPDIRYLKVVARTKTHFTNVTLQDILQERNSFKAGMLFHSLVDETREIYVAKNKLYEKIPHFRFSTQALKFAEDQILRSQCDITKYHTYFDDIIDIEKTYGVDQGHINRWHTFLQDYFKTNYSGHDLMLKYFDLSEPHAWCLKRWIFSWLHGHKIQKTMSLVTENEHFGKNILDFYVNFSNRFNKQATL